MDHDRKTCSTFRFRSYAKLLFSANKIPPSRDRTHAFYRRWLILPLPKNLTAWGVIPTLIMPCAPKLKAEVSGILNRALGLDRLHANNAFTQPQSVIDAKRAYMRDNDHMQVFLEECGPDLNAMIVKKEFRAVR